MILLVQFTKSGYETRYVLVDTVIDKFTDEYPSIEYLIKNTKLQRHTKYWKVGFSNIVIVGTGWNQTNYDVSDVNFAGYATATISAIYNKFPELLL
jgi:hypothetical protein